MRADASRLVEAYMAKRAQLKDAEKRGDRQALLGLRRELEAARVAAVDAIPSPKIPKVGELLALSSIDPTSLLLAIHSRLSSCVATASVVRAPRQVFRAVTRTHMEVGCGGFAQLAQNAHGWFRVAGRAYDALGQQEAARHVQEAWKICAREGPAVRRLPYPEYLSTTELGRFDDGYPLLEVAVGLPLVTYVRAHADDFLDLDDE